MTDDQQRDKEWKFEDKSKNRLKHNFSLKLDKMTLPESQRKEASSVENSLNEEDKQLLKFGKDIMVMRSLLAYIAQNPIDDSDEDEDEVILSNN